MLQRTCFLGLVGILSQGRI